MENRANITTAIFNRIAGRKKIVVVQKLFFLVFLSIFVLESFCFSQDFLPNGVIYVNRANIAN
jgi:hypothetical protein